MSEKDTLLQYGSVFQSKVLTLLFTRKLFIQQISEILEPVFFDDEADQWIVEKILTYFEKYKECPTIPSFEIDVRSIANDTLKIAVVQRLSESMKYIESTDLDYVEDRILEFTRNQCMKNAVLSSVRMVREGEYDKVRDIIDKAVNAGQPKDTGYNYIEESVEARYEESARFTVKTGFEVVDSAMDGGLSAGELGVIVAPSGVGKSWMLQAISAAAVKRGQTVVYYSLELREEYLSRRFDAIYTGIDVQELKYHIPEIEKSVKGLKGECILKYHPSGTLSVRGIAAHLEMLKLEGVKPDVVVVDYADLLKPKNTKDMRPDLVLGETYTDLRSISGEYDIPLWTASQTQRGGLEDDEIEANRIAGAYAKIMVADFVMSLQRKKEDKVNNTGRGYIIKNRFGPDGLTLPARINTSNGDFEFFESKSNSGRDVLSKQKDGKLVVHNKLLEKFKMMEER